MMESSLEAIIVLNLVRLKVTLMYWFHFLLKAIRFGVISSKILLGFGLLIVWIVCHQAEYSVMSNKGKTSSSEVFLFAEGTFDDLQGVFGRDNDQLGVDFSQLGHLKSLRMGFSVSIWSFCV